MFDKCGTICEKDVCLQNTLTVTQLSKCPKMFGATILL